MSIPTLKSLLVCSCFDDENNAKLSGFIFEHSDIFSTPLRFEDWLVISKLHESFNLLPFFFLLLFLFGLFTLLSSCVKLSVNYKMAW